MPGMARRPKNHAETTAAPAEGQMAVMARPLGWAVGSSTSSASAQ